MRHAAACLMYMFCHFCC